MMRVSAALLLSITGASAFGTYPDVPATCSNGIGDNPTFADIWDLDCAAWSVDTNSNGLPDCSLDDIITDDSVCTATDGSTLMDSDGIPCEIGGHLDGAGYYYTASHMFEVRYNCPVSCDYCPENSNPSCVDSTTFADIYTFDCAAWSADYNSNGVSDCSLDDVITDPSACVDSTDGSTLMGPGGVACEVGGHLDADGYYYTASHMFEVRLNCPVSCSWGCE